MRRRSLARKLGQRFGGNPAEPMFVPRPHQPSPPRVSSKPSAPPYRQHHRHVRGDDDGNESGGHHCAAQWRGRLRGRGRLATRAAPVMAEEELLLTGVLDAASSSSLGEVSPIEVLLVSCSLVLLLPEGEVSLLVGQVAGRHGVRRRELGRLPLATPASVALAFRAEEAELETVLPTDGPAPLGIITLLAAVVVALPRPLHNRVTAGDGARDADPRVAIAPAQRLVAEESAVEHLPTEVRGVLVVRCVEVLSDEGCDPAALPTDGMGLNEDQLRAGARDVGPRAGGVVLAALRRADHGERRHRLYRGPGRSPGAQVLPRGVACLLRDLDDIPAGGATQVHPHGHDADGKPALDLLQHVELVVQIRGSLKDVAVHRHQSVPHPPAQVLREFAGKADDGERIIRQLKAHVAAQQVRDLDLLDHRSGLDLRMRCGARDLPPRLPLLEFRARLLRGCNRRSRRRTCGGRLSCGCWGGRTCGRFGRRALGRGRHSRSRFCRRRPGCGRLGGGRLKRGRRRRGGRRRCAGCGWNRSGGRRCRLRRSSRNWRRRRPLRCRPWLLLLLLPRGRQRVRVLVHLAARLGLVQQEQAGPRRRGDVVVAQIRPRHAGVAAARVRHVPPPLVLLEGPLHPSVPVTTEHGSRHTLVHAEE
mmetsp:Transcript_70117/g.203324  ORF Transcript_70117/g.203324 Transcript_70117/m.203324 type:complete len:646 (-) Transcript_70117:2802-4739(-)